VVMKKVNKISVAYMRGQISGSASCEKGGLLLGLDGNIEKLATRDAYSCCSGLI